MPTFWVVIERLLLVFGWIGMLAPFAGMYLGLRDARKRQWPVGKTVASAVAGFGAGTVVLALALGASCRFPPSGSGVEAESGYLRAEPVISALSRYRSEHGSYPDSLSMLVPAYLAPDTLADRDTTHESRPFLYRRSEASYELAFEYVGPAMNRCTYSPGRPWHCVGYW